MTQFERLFRSVARAQLVAALAVLGATVLLVFVARGHSQIIPATQCPQRCAMPDGLDLSLLSREERTRLTRRVLLCADLECGRISEADYASSLAMLDEPRDCPAPPLPKTPTWATSVRSFSSQYTAESWSAQRLLGAPDATPVGTDNVNAWAPSNADGGPEFIEVGFEAGHRSGGLRIVESLNPGTIQAIELIDASGETFEIFDGPTADWATPSLSGDVRFDCTSVAAVKITLDTKSVAGWNEIDAIGLLPCE